MEPVARRLLAIGLAAQALYIVLALRYPLRASLADPRASWLSLNGKDLPWSFAQIGIYLGLVLLYLAALRLLTRLSGAGSEAGSKPELPPRWVNRLIIAVWLGCSFVLMTAAPAGESHDLFDYVFRGRMMAEFNANPLVALPKQYNHEAFYDFIAWHAYVDTYGPLWEIVSKGVATGVRLFTQELGWWIRYVRPCSVSEPTCRLLIVYVSGYRLMAIGLTGLSAWLITRLVKNSQPEMRSAALAAWLWNPLTLIATALGGHNDLWLIALLLAGILLMQRKQPFWAMMALVLALHIKLTAFIWVPAFGLWILRKWGWRRAAGVGAGSLVCAVAISWLLYAPFGGWISLPRMLYERSLFYAYSIWDVLARLLTLFGVPWSIVYRVNVNLSTFLFLAGILSVALWSLNFLPQRWKRPPFDLEQRHFWMMLAATSAVYLVLG
ncbi:MAG: DUF2029 domain-containing protein, partial [Anaerolineaceae bacterium]|nr:DUF2029 domain-containing protein [Anaerolineaceae bacterium]